MELKLKRVLYSWIYTSKGGKHGGDSHICLFVSETTAIRTWAQPSPV